MTARSSLNQRNARGHRPRLQFGGCRIVHLSPTFNRTPHLLTSGADYSDLYDALFQACNNLSGISGITSNDCNQVRDATIASVAAMTGNTMLPANAFLHFAHAFGLESPDFDGGGVEYSTNNGSTWFDAGALFDANGYVGTINSMFSNLLRGRAAFIGESHRYRHCQGTPGILPARWGTESTPRGNRGFAE